MEHNILPESWKDLDVLCPRWKRGIPENLQDARIFTLQKLPSTSPESGKNYEFFRLLAKDWINVVALTPDEKIVMVVQQRHGIDTATLEIPAGLVDKGEEPINAALRELEEETGYVPEEIIHLGTSFPNPAFLTNRCFSFLAKNCCPVGKIRRDPAEEIQVFLVPASKLHFLLVSGMLGNSSGIVALFWFDLYLRGIYWNGDENMVTGPAVSPP